MYILKITDSSKVLLHNKIISNQDSFLIIIKPLDLFYSSDEKKNQRHHRMSFDIGYNPGFFMKYSFRSDCRR